MPVANQLCDRVRLTFTLKVSQSGDCPVNGDVRSILVLKPVDVPSDLTIPYFFKIHITVLQLSFDRHADMYAHALSLSLFNISNICLVGHLSFYHFCP